MSEEEKEEKSIEDLYVNEEVQEIDIEGVTIKFKELSGIEYTEIIDELDMVPDDPTSISNKEFIVKMIERCVVEPEDIDVERLKSGALTKITNEIQGGLNLEGAMENLGKK